MHTHYNNPVEKRDGTGTLLRGESYGHFSSRGERLGHSLRGRAHRPLPGEAFIVFLGSSIKERFIFYYIECYCLHFSYSQGNENNKCRRERWQADYALTLGKFTQALEITLKIGSKHLLFQTRVTEI